MWDLTVLGARGLRPRKRFFVGSTSLAVVRYVPCPVAIVRGRPQPVRHVLVSVNGSKGPRAALRFLSSFQLLRDTRVSLLHVLQRPAVPGLHRLFTSLPDQQRGEDRRTHQANAEKVLAGAVAVLAEARSPVERRVVDGDPAQEIVSIARRRDVDLVVLGSRGLRFLGGPFRCPAGTAPAQVIIGARETNERHPRHRAEDEDRLHDRPGHFVPGAAPGAPRERDERGPAQFLSR